MEADLTECPPVDLEAFKVMLACNRCSDYERERRDAEAAIVVCCEALLTARQYRAKHKLPEFENAIAEKLTNLTRWFASVVCRHNNVPFAWDSDFVSQLLEKPLQTKRKLKFYLHSISRLAA